ncbi:MAG TPA: radical SAM protein [Myxococcales bacterium]|nr:radical SAM protein [Myxococcales bacterium]
MRISLISGNRERLPDAVIPLGLLYVSASIQKEHTSQLLDLCFEERPMEALAAHLAEFAPDIVALGMRNIQNADYSGFSNTIDYYAQLIEVIRGATTAPVVMGGAGFSVMPEELMRRLRPDYGISGEAEMAFPALISALEQKTSFSAIPNLHYFAGGKEMSTPSPAGFLDMGSLPRPDRTLADPRYYTEYGIESLQTKRGCPLRCDYCTYPIIEGRVGRTRSPVDVVDELVEITAGHPDVRHVFVVDSVFNLPRAHAKEVCREIIKRGLTVPWTCYANPLGFDAELAHLMAQANCAGIEVGADSGSEEVLKRLRKGFTTQDIRTLHQLADRAGIPDCHTFLLGTPGESFDDVLQTLDFIVDLDPFSAILMAWVDDYEALDPALAKERQALREQVLKLLDEHSTEFSWWSIPSIGVNYDASLFDVLRKRGHHGPLWQHLRNLSPGKTNVRRVRSSPEAHSRK